MSHPRIKTSQAPDERIPAHVISDHDWVRQHQDELRAQYGEQYIVVYQHHVYGIGDTRKAALANAEQNLPLEIEQLTVMVEPLHRRHPLFRVIPKG